MTTTRTAGQVEPSAIKPIGADMPAIDHAVRLIDEVCCFAGSFDLLKDTRDEELCAAIERRDNAALFVIRDVADGDLIGWIDDRLDQANDPLAPDRLARACNALIEPLRNIYGVSDKVLAIGLSGILIGAANVRPRWFEVGVQLIAVDTLVHNFLHRTGILRRFKATHPYGVGCYRPGGCADIIARVARQIDARAFNPSFPALFPRFVQLAIWQYCSQQGLDICNGNRIDDRHRCQNSQCRLYSTCDRIRLK